MLSTRLSRFIPQVIRSPAEERLFSTASSAFSEKYPHRKYKITLLDIPAYLKPMFNGKMEHEYPEGVTGWGERPIGVRLPSGEFVKVPEMIPELVVPDLKDFKLKPYVSFKAPNNVEPELTARDLYDAVYGKQVKEDFEKGLLKDELSDTIDRAANGGLKKHSYDADPPRMLDTSKVRVV